MKTTKYTILLMMLSFLGFAQNKNAKATIEVDGVCMMCKNRIEKACLKTKGVKSAVWNVKTQNLSLIYDERKVDLEAIKSKVAEAGHDTKTVKARDEAYEGLHPCCKYRDEEIQADHKSN
ncbi:MAG: heavy-metal-associated domain-containing protein [Flavobacteriaceae bacterium]|nr:heavy-metal-associated domain-containing protein [Flavobacteriaceae bacterium]